MIVEESSPSRISMCGLTAALVLAALTVLSGRGTEPPATAMSCFVIGGQMTCIDVGIAPANPGIPAVVAPIGPVFGGEDEEITMSDDGGYQVARG